MSDMQRKIEWNWLFELTVLGLVISILVSLFSSTLIWVILPAIIGFALGFLLLGLRSYRKSIPQKGKGNQCESIKQKMTKDARAIRLYGSLINIASMAILIAILVLILV